VWVEWKGRRKDCTRLNGQASARFTRTPGVRTGRKCRHETSLRRVRRDYVIGWPGGSAGDILLFSSRPPRDFKVYINGEMTPIGLHDNSMIGQSSTVVETRFAVLPYLVTVSFAIST